MEHSPELRKALHVRATVETVAADKTADMRDIGRERRVGSRHLSPEEADDQFPNGKWNDNRGVCLNFFYLLYFIAHRLLSLSHSRGQRSCACEDVGSNDFELCGRSALRLHLYASSLAVYHVFGRDSRRSRSWFGPRRFACVLFLPFLISNVSDTVAGNPFRETGPPANMAKLILLRHKVSPTR